MIKRLLALCLISIGLSCAAHEPGDMSVGLNLGVAPGLENYDPLTNFGFGLNYRYHLTSSLRLEAATDYWVRNRGCDMFDVVVNAHYLFGLGKNCYVYPLVGIGYALIGDSNSYFNMFYETPSGSKILFNAGLGFQYDISSKFAIGAEVKYRYVKHYQQLPVTVGLSYKF